MPSFKLTQFQGLVPRLRPNNLGQALAQVAEDVDLSQQTLKPWRTDKKISDKTGRTLFVEPDCCVLTAEKCGAKFSQIHTDCRYIIATGIADYPQIQKSEQACNEEWVQLGFPEELPTPNAQFLGTLPEDFNQELRQYIYTLVDVFDFESSPSEPSEPIYAHNDENVVISGLPSSTDFPTYSISKVRIYCAVTPLDYGNPQDQNYDAHFLLVDEIDFGTTSYVHIAHTIYGEACSTEEYAPPDENIFDLQVCGNGQLGGLVGEELWLSEPLKPWAYPEAFRYGRFLGTPKRFIVADQLGYVLTDKFPAVVQISEPNNENGLRSVTVLNEPLPIISPESACSYGSSCFYATKDGLVMLSGNQAKIITTGLFTSEQWQALMPWTMKGIIHDGYFFGFTESTGIRFKVPDNIHEEVQAMNLTTLSIKPTALYRSSFDNLYFADETGVHQWNAGDSWKTFTWRGRLQDLGGYTAMTAYKLMHEYSPTQVKHIAYKRHRSEMVQEPVVLGDKTVIDSRPQRLKQGYSTLYLDVEIKGQGEVWEYHLASSVAELEIQ